jgi:hypothetical protein
MRYVRMRLDVLALRRVVAEDAQAYDLFCCECDQQSSHASCKLVSAYACQPWETVLS